MAVKSEIVNHLSALSNAQKRRVITLNIISVSFFLFFLIFLFRRENNHQTETTSLYNKQSCCHQCKFSNDEMNLTKQRNEIKKIFRIDRMKTKTEKKKRKQQTQKKITQHNTNIDGLPSSISES